MSRTAILAAALLGTLLASAPAQVQTFGGSFPRMSARVLYFGRTAPLGQICVQYGQPVWKAEYDRLLDETRDASLRLGADFWSSLDTDLDLTIGGVEVPAGQWYLGLRMDGEGRPHLLVMDAAAVRRQKGDASGTSGFQARINVPLRHTRTDDTVERLAMALRTEGRKTGESELVLSWGRHRLTASVLADLPAGGDPRPPIER